MKKKIAAKIRAAVSGLTSTAASASTVAAAAAATATPTSTIAAHEIPPPRVNPMQVQAARQELASRELVPYVEFVHKPALSTARHMAEWADIFMHPSKTKPHTLIIAPPGSSKTSWSSKFLPCFLIGQNPGLHVGVVTSTAKRAWKLSLACRDTVTEVPEYQQVFPHVRPNKAKGWARDQWFVERPQKDDPDPTMTSCGLFGDILGSRLDFLIFDDIFDEETIGSDTLRERGRKWVRNTAMTRLDPSKGRAVAILTRWSGVTEDLVAEFEKDKRSFVLPVTGYVQGGRVWLPKDVPWAKRFVSSLGNFNPDREQKDDEVLAFTHGMLWLTKSKSVSLTQDCLIKPSGLSENVGSMGTRFATQLGLGGSPGGSWFDQM